MTLRVLSIRQPWAWLILHAGKDVENRTWPTTYRGRFLIHAAQKLDEDACWAFLARGMQIPDDDEFERGGIVGEAEIVDCVQRSSSRWFVGPHGFVLRNPRPLPFRVCRGQLGFFAEPPLAAAEQPVVKAQKAVPPDLFSALVEKGTQHG